MTRAEAYKEWKTHHLPVVRQQYEQDGAPDRPARAESWGAYTDDLCKGGKITPHQYHTWRAP